MEALQSSNSSEAPPPYQSEIKRNKKVGRDGFTILWDGVGSDGKGVPLVDLIFVHGIEGGPEKTWSSKSSAPQHKSIWPRFNSENRTAARNPRILESGTFWPIDFLPSTIPQARILTWGYESSVLHPSSKTVNPDTYHSIYKDLLYDVNDIRAEDGRKRPIIWIAHGFGRTIVKEVLLRSISTIGVDATRPLKDIYESTRALLFLGTPLGTPLRSGLQERFSNLPEKGRFRIMTFREEDVDPKSTIDYSNVMDNLEAQRTLPGNYLGMCKFSRVTDIGYRRIHAELISIINEVQQSGFHSSALLRQNYRGKNPSVAMNEKKQRMRSGHRVWKSIVLC